MTDEEIDTEIARLTRLKKLNSKRSSKVKQTDQTPLSIMQGYIDHALSKVDGDTQKEFVEFIWPQIEGLGISENQKVTKEQQATINKLIANGYTQFKKGSAAPASAQTPEQEPVAPVTPPASASAPAPAAPATSPAAVSGPKQIANTNKAVSEAKPGDWLIRKNGQKIVLKAADIAWAKNLLSKR